ncbi:MAG: PAS domain S-box protein [Candidatus Aureabacteria bacterium]|nr:PAS domain S-box protein [Candidatus Auribacterota bacterium]
MKEETRSKEELLAEIEKLKHRLVDVQALQVQRRLIEEALREKEELMSAIVKGFDGYIYICSHDYIVTFMNENLVKRTGRDATGEKCYEVLHGRKSICPWCVNEKVFKGETAKWELLSPKDNRWFYIINTPIFDGEKVISKMSMFIDITERKRFEERLRENEEKFKKLFELAPFAVFLETIDGDIIDCNEEAAKMLGYTKEKLKEMNIKDLVSAKTAKMLPGLIEASLSFGGFSVEAENRDKNGREFPVKVDARILEINNEKTVFVLVQDITESKRAEEALIREKKLHTRGPVVVFRWFAKEDWPVEYVSNNVKQFGYSAEDFLKGRIKYADIVHPDDRERIEREVKQYSKKGVDKFEQEYRIFTADKTEKFLYDSTVIVRDRKGRITHYEGYVLDITDRKIAEKELRYNQERYKAIVEGQTELICRFLPDNTLTFVNEAYGRYFGKKCKDLIGKKFLPCVLSADRKMVLERLKSLSAESPIEFHEQRIKLPGGEVRWQHWTNRAILDDNGDIKEIQAVGRDITDRKIAEKEKEKLIEDLQYALAQVKTLRGLLPICSHCKKVRDDKGYWHQVEEYLKKYSEIAFSHGICPDCRKKLYPELAKRKSAEKKRRRK